MWQQVAQFSANSTGWSYSSPVEGRYFRVRSNIAPGGWGRFLLGQAEAESSTHYGIKRFYLAHGKADLYDLRKPLIWTERRLCSYFGNFLSGSGLIVYIDKWDGYEAAELEIIQVEGIQPVF